MRTLFVSNVLPWPLDTGANIRIHHLLQAVAEVSEVSLVCFTHPWEEAGNGIEGIRGIVRDVHAIPRTSCRYQRLIDLPVALRRVGRLLEVAHPYRPSAVSAWRSEAATVLLEELRRQQFDVVWGEGLCSISFLHAFPAARRVLDLLNLEHPLLKRRLRQTKFGIRLVLDYIEFLKLRRLECRTPRMGCEVSVCSEEERRVLGGGDHVWVIPNGVVLPAPPAKPVEPEGDTLLFPGTMDYQPNVDAAHYFCEQVFPLVRAKLPHVRLRIAGRRPGPAVNRLNDGQAVFVHADVPDMGTYFRQATAVVVPIRFGGGTRIKILEAMAHRTPVISSTVGAEGIGAKSGEELLLADTPAAFADACVRVCQDQSLRSRLAASGYRFVEQHYQWSSIASRVHALVTGGVIARDTARTDAVPCCSDVSVSRDSEDRQHRHL